MIFKKGNLFTLHSGVPTSLQVNISSPKWTPTFETGITPAYKVQLERCPTEATCTHKFPEEIYIGQRSTVIAVVTSVSMSLGPGFTMIMSLVYKAERHLFCKHNWLFTLFCFPLPIIDLFLIQVQILSQHSLLECIELKVEAGFSDFMASSFRISSESNKSIYIQNLASYMEVVWRYIKWKHLIFFHIELYI